MRNIGRRRGGFFKSEEEMEYGGPDANEVRQAEIQKAIDEAEWIILRPRIRSALEGALTELAEMLGFLRQLEARLSGEFPEAGRERARRKLLEQLRLTRHAVAKSLEGARQTLRCYQ